MSPARVKTIFLLPKTAVESYYKKNISPFPLMGQESYLSKNHFSHFWYWLKGPVRIKTVITDSDFSVPPKIISLPGEFTR